MPQINTQQMTIKAKKEEKKNLKINDILVYEKDRTKSKFSMSQIISFYVFSCYFAKLKI